MVEIINTSLPVSQLGFVHSLLLTENSMLSIPSNPSLNQNPWGGEAKKLAFSATFQLMFI